MPEKQIPRIIPEVIEDQINQFLDKLPQTAPPQIRDILFESKQSTLGRAILSDLVDIIPVAGDLSNFFRVRHAATIGFERPRRLTRQTIDMLVGLAPEPLGGILDLLTPTNTVTYLREKRGT